MKSADELMLLLKTWTIPMASFSSMNVEQSREFRKSLHAKILEWHKHKAQPLVDALEEYSKKENWDNGGFDFDGEDVYCIFTKPLGKAGWTYAQQVLSKYKEIKGE